MIQSQQNENKTFWCECKNVKMNCNFELIQQSPKY